MIPYAIAITLSFLACWITTSKKLSLKTSMATRVVLISLPLFVISALRFNVGTDYVNYVSILQRLKYEEYYKYYGSKELEPLYMLLNYIILYLNLDAQWLFVVTSAIYTTVVVYVIVKYSRNQYLSIFLLFGSTAFFEQMNTMRAHVAYAILLIGLINLLKGKKRRYIVLCIIAGLFHYSSFVFLIVMFVTDRSFTPRIAIALVAGCAMFSFVLVNVANRIIQLSTYSIYLERLDVSGGGVAGILIQLLIFVVMTIFYQNKNTEYKVLYLLETINFIITLFIGSIPLIARMRWVFYYPVLLLGLPAVVSSIRKTHTRLLITSGLIIGYAVYMYITIVINRGYGVYPYQWIL